MIKHLKLKLREYRISLFTLGALALLVLTVYSNQLSKQFAEEAFKQLQKTKQDRIELMQSFSEQLLRTGQVANLRELLLQDSKKIPKGISGFCLNETSLAQSKRSEHGYPSEGNPRFTPYFKCSSLCQSLPYHNYSDEFSGADTCVNGVQLSLFQFAPKEAFVTQYRMADILTIAKDCLLVAFLIFSILLLIKSELKQAEATILLGPGHLPAKKSFPSFLRDTLTLKKGLSSLSLELREEKNRSQSASQQLSRALQKFYDPMQVLPLHFTGTLLRCDVNGFSEMVKIHGKTAVFPFVKQFLIAVSKAAEVFQGYELEYAGDEVILFFKDALDYDSKKAALFFLKEIEALSDRTHAKSEVEFQFPFRVKVSLSWGTVMLARDESGVFFSSEEFIRTVRLLKKVSVKDQNTFLCSSYFTKELGTWFKATPLGSFALAGYATPHDLLQISEIKAAESILLDKNDDPDLVFYARSLKDRIAILRYFEQILKNGLQSEHLIWLDRLKQLPQSNQVSDEESVLVEKILKTAFATTEGANLTKVVAVIAKLAPPDKAPNVSALFLEALHSAEPRLLADLIHYLGSCKINIPDSMLIRLHEHPSNRVAANLLIYELLNPETEEKARESAFKRLVHFLKSKEVSILASAVYAFGEVAKVLLTQSVAAFNAHSELQVAYQQCLRHLGHSSEKVRKQAQLAFFKMGRENEVAAYLKDN